MMHHRVLTYHNVKIVCLCTTIAPLLFAYVHICYVHMLARHLFTICYCGRAVYVCDRVKWGNSVKTFVVA